MNTGPLSSARSFAVAAAVVLLAACSDMAPIAPDHAIASPGLLATREPADGATALATLRRVTARYHDLDAALRDGFVFLHGCEVRPDEGPVGIVYINFARLTDGKIDPESPDGLIYTPSKNGKPKLVAVELATPFQLWSAPQPPAFLGYAFQREDEFGVFGLHAWVWRDNPEGMFAETNPRVTCEPE